MPLARSVISVPPDVPVGTEIYRQTISMSPQIAFRILCGTAGNFATYYRYQQLPLPASAVTVPSRSGTIYETGVPGIGAMFWYSSRGFPVSLTLTDCQNISGCNVIHPFASDFSLFKIGEIEAGTIQASNLPVAIYSMGQSESNKVDLMEVSLSGSITVTAATCQLAEPNKVVLLGEHNVSDFTGKGSATPFKDASIQLINCPMFYGNSGGRGSMGTFNGTEFKASNTSIHNSWIVTFMPNTSVVDAANGIMGIDVGSESAGGVGIQLASSDSDADVLNLAKGYTGSFTSDGSPAVTVPLYARYIQTEDVITPGKANGMLTYMLEYR